VLSDVIDLSVPFYEGMPTEDDLPPKFWERMSHATARRLYNNTQSRAGRIFLTTDYTGTHIDGPLRFDSKGEGIEQVPLDRVIRPARLLDFSSLGREGIITSKDLEKKGNEIAAGDAVVLWTGHDIYRKSADYFGFRPYLTNDGAEWLAERKVGIVAADFPGIGRPNDLYYECKRILHRAGILTVEQLCKLNKLEGKSWYLFAAPLRIRGGAGSPIRAVGLVDWQGSEIVDLTLDIHSTMPSLGPVPSTWTRAKHSLIDTFYDHKVSYQTHGLFLNEHAGTHFDVPFHFVEEGPAIDDVPVASLFYRAHVFDMSHKLPLEAITPEDLSAAANRAGLKIGKGDAAVVWTGHSKNYYTRPDFGTHRPYITEEGAKWLVATGAGVVATDLIGLDPPTDLSSPVHRALLYNGVCMLQVLTNLDKLVGDGWYIGAFPMKLVGGTGAPLRAFAAKAAS
jgi:kynurenine formamidase